MLCSKWTSLGAVRPSLPFSPPPPPSGESARSARRVQSSVPRKGVSVSQSAIFPDESIYLHFFLKKPTTNQPTIYRRQSIKFWIWLCSRLFTEDGFERRIRYIPSTHPPPQPPPLPQGRIQELQAQSRPPLYLQSTLPTINDSNISFCPQEHFAGGIIDLC